MTRDTNHGVPWRHPTSPTGGIGRKTHWNMREAPCSLCEQWRNVKKGRYFTDPDGTPGFACGRCKNTNAFKARGVTLRPW